MSARRLILILGDQLTHGLGALKDIDREHDHDAAPMLLDQYRASARGVRSRSIGTG